MADEGCGVLFGCCFLNKISRKKNPKLPQKQEKGTKNPAGQIKETHEKLFLRLKLSKLLFQYSKPFIPINPLYCTAGV